MACIGFDLDNGISIITTYYHQYFFNHNKYMRKIM